MGNLDNTTLRDLIEVLAPGLRVEDARRPFLERVFGADFPPLWGLVWTGPVEPFVLRLADALADASVVANGKHAMEQLVEAVREHADPGLQARIDALKPIIERPTAKPAVPGADPVHVRVFLASPGDVADERALAIRALDQLPYDPLLRGQATIETVAWDRPGSSVPMLATLTPQAAIAAGLPKPSECDIVVVIFWSRMGTPLPEEYRKPDGSAYLSGTEWEYLDALARSRRDGKPRVLVYRRTEEPRIGMNDPEFDEKRRQYQRVNDFFASFRNPDGSIRSGCNDYKAPEDFRQQLDLHLRSLIRRLLDSRATDTQSTRLSIAPSPAPKWPGSPFPGLRAFTPLDAPIYFGRGRETDELVRSLARGERLQVVVGASGSGKSSLVAAGLLPRLADNAIEGAKDWLLPQAVAPSGTGRVQWLGLRFTPGELGNDPFVALAAKLAPMLPPDTSGDVAQNVGELARELETRPESLASYVALALDGAPAWSEVLLFVDQLEELFTLVAERHRSAFVALLVAASQTPRLRTLGTLRADFYHLCVALPDLSRLLRAATFPLAAPGLASLFEMITGPAAPSGLAFDEGLPARILEDVGTDPGALALLAFALHELYEARGGHGRLTVMAYESFGGVAGAISVRAESTFARLSADSQAILAIVFRDLVDVDARGVATRRRAQRFGCPGAMELVARFTDARLLVSGLGPEGAPLVEVAHEALLRQWTRLADWIAERADDLRELRHAEAAAAEWRHRGGHPSHQWSHERLAPVFDALTRLGLARADLEEPARSFLQPEAERLLAELESPHASHYRRTEIGDRLARIGDPRPGVGLLPDGIPDLVWCDVPAGVVTLEDNAGGFQVDAFRIAKLPVTWRQYQAFLVHPNGYRSERWWKGLRREKEPGEQYRQIANCPAENVSWFDAMACCRWLDAQWREREEIPDGLQLRLPTEQEWQMAASCGDPARQYPWPGEWDDRHANTEESRLGRTTSAGMYPAGAGPNGALDMAGNVWEWCHNRYSPKDESENGPRVLRGGSWSGARDGCRCAYRFGYVPGGRGGSFGFRVCCAPPIS